MEQIHLLMYSNVYCVVVDQPMHRDLVENFLIFPFSPPMGFRDSLIAPYVFNSISYNFFYHLQFRYLVSASKITLL